MRIGLEVHVALPTKTKLFCGDLLGQPVEPNDYVCPICLGFPGSRPVLNKEAVKIAKSVSAALNCKIKSKISFLRKVYFYPDLPKSFQITQLSESIGSEGWIELENKKIRIRRVQIEEDPAKLVHSEGYTLIDFNRSGTPLVEIVTEPDIVSEDELRETIFTLRALLYYLGVDVNQEIKADLNISLGENRVEVKNVTGVNNLISAAEHEIKRQSSIIAAGKEPEKETRSFDEGAGTTKSSRKKESDEEYGFIYEPDLTEYSTDGLEVSKSVIPTAAARTLAKNYSFSYKTILELIAFDAAALQLIESAKDKFDFKTVINGVETLKRFDETGMSVPAFSALLKLLSEKVDITQEIVEKIKAGKAVDVKRFSEDEIDKAIMEMLEKDKTIIKRYEKNKNVVNFIVGEVSKRYKIQPRDVLLRINEIINKLLNKEN